MSFVVFADGTANLPRRLLDVISLIPLDYTVDGQSKTYQGDIDSFDGQSFYEKLRKGSVVRTTLINMHSFLSRFTPALRQGLDIIYISMSSAISGTFQSARNAATELMEQYRDRFVHIVDSKGCGFGSGMLALRAQALCRRGVDVKEAAAELDEQVPHACQYFTVDDLNFLKRTGRVSGVTAKIATVLDIKPILFGAEDGRIVSCAKVRGRKQSIAALAKKYNEKRIRSGEQQVFISHGDCLQDAQTLSGLIREITPDVPITICQHEPVSGSHVGPGMLGLFFNGNER